MPAKTHEYLVLAFDNVTDALASERQGHYYDAIASIEAAHLELAKAHELATKIMEKHELRASKKA